MRRRLVKAVLALVLLVALTSVGVYEYLRQSLPVTDGTIEVGGISMPVEIVRDADDIPHILAKTKADAFYGLGYVHAQDRLWQMEIQRRIGYGRLSEIFGDVTLPEDRFLRTVGFGRAAAAAWESLPPDARHQIDAYVSGVNEFVATHHGRSLPPEFTLLRFEPRPWIGVDVLVWVKMMAWDLSANYAWELMRHDLAGRIGPERMAQLLPPVAADSLSILTSPAVGGRPVVPRTATTQSPAHLKVGTTPIPAGRWDDIQGSWFAALTAGLSSKHSTVRNLLLGGTAADALGSNSWVVDGTLTASGKPLLAGDPHLSAQIPSLWYLAHMSAGDFDVIGATLPGTPAVAIGRNRFIAWGETNVAADVEDLYRERLDPSGLNAEFGGRFEPLRLVKETIAVKGADPVHLDVRISRHGPLISDAINANNAAKPSPDVAQLEPLALRWTALDDVDRSLLAFLNLNDARNWTDFTNALRDFSGPAQNFLFADVEGHIGYYAPGQIPIRASGDGSLPADGWTGDAEWTGWIPFDELPHVYDPPEHFIVTANNRPAPPPYPHFISQEYPEPYRAQRLTDLIRHGNGLTPDDFRTIQADTFSEHAQTLLPLLLLHVRPQQPADRQAVELLRRWNFDARGDGAAPAIFQAWFLRLAPAFVGDDLGPVALKSYQGRFSYITRFVMRTLTSGLSSWCDDVRTSTRETCEETVTAALHEAVDTLTRQLGGDMSRWRWDRLHKAVFPHQGLDAVGLLRPLLSRSVSHGGDWGTVDVGPTDTDRPFEQREIPSYRQIVDLSPANDSRFVDAVGQSGHFLSKHYADFLPDWHDVRHRRMRMDRADIEKGAIGHLRLTPRRAE